MSPNNGNLMIFGLLVAASIELVSARFCEGGHRCSPPKECCAQGCCYLYAPPSAPRTPAPNTSHVLNLFFINHWFFWCIIFAIVIAILCACSLWKKRRQICGWGLPRPHSQSGDSAGSCYAPPQYSRCNSFHHAPPPYTEVTSKPDLYPLVFSCNADNGKNGSSYLMVQYFRNYIVRPTTVGSLSATSTVDSLSSSFICNANEANTLVPPPYSRAASPDLPLTIQEYSSMPRSASQQGCSIEQIRMHRLQRTMHSFPSNGSTNDIEHVSFYRQPFNDVNGIDSTQNIVTHAIDNNGSTYNIGNIDDNNQCDMLNNIQRMHSNSANELDTAFERRININNSNSNSDNNNLNQLMNLNMSHSDQPFRYVKNKSPSSLSDANRCDVISNTQTARSDTNTTIESDENASAITRREHKQYMSQNQHHQHHHHQQQPQQNNEKQKQQQHTHSLLSGNFSEESPVNVELLKKYGSMRSYINSITGSAVSSLANIGSPDSPPQATSPTGEVKVLLEQIRQLQQSTGSQDELGDTHSINRRNDGTSNESTDAYDGDESSPSNGTLNIIQSIKIRPSTLQQNRRLSGRTRLFAMSGTKNLRSPISSGGSILNFGRGRKGWISKSAPSTPGTAMPSCFLDDNSPLLNEHDEDAEPNT